MDIDNLKIILKVAEFSSINKASLSVYKTQSQVSRIVRDFESLLDEEVFERSTRGVHPTEEGKEILTYCEKIVSLYDEMCALHKEKSITDYHGAIDIYTTINIHSTISEIIATFSNTYPNIAINYKTMAQEDVITSVQENPHAIGAFPQIYTESGAPYYDIPDYLTFTEYLHTPIVAQCNEKSKVAQKYKSLSAKTLTTLPLIDFNPYRTGASFTATLLQLMGIDSPIFQYSTDDLRVLQTLISKGSGIYIGICPSLKLLGDNIALIPIRNKIKVSFGSLVQKDNKNDLVALFQRFLADWYTKIY